MVTGRPRRSRGSPGSRQRLAVGDAGVRRRRWPAGCGSPGATAGSTWSSARPSRRSRYIEQSLPIVGAARNRFSDWLWSMYGARAAARSISARCGSSHAVRNSSRTSAGRSAMPCTEPSARLIASRICVGPQAAGLQLAHQRGVDLEELAGQRLALEQVGHLRLDALVAAGDRGDRRGRRDRDQQRVAQPVRGDPLPQRGPALGLRRRRRPTGPAAAGPGRPGSRAYAGCGAEPLGQVGRGLQRGQVDLLGDPGGQLPRRRRSRTAAAARRTRPAGPSRPSPTGRQRGLDAAASRLG